MTKYHVEAVHLAIIGKKGQQNYKCAGLNFLTNVQPVVQIYMTLLLGNEIISTTKFH